MTEFCGCSKPNIVSEENEISLTVRCENCGMEAATTNQNYFDQRPWLQDKTIYEISIVPKGLNKKEYVSLLNTHSNYSVLAAAKMYQENQEGVLYKGSGQEFYNFVTMLKSKAIEFMVYPKCAYM